MAEKKKSDRDVAESLAFIVERMATKDDLKKFATKDDVREIVREETQPQFKKVNERLGAVEDRLTGVENKLTGLYRMHEADGMKAADLRLPRRVHNLEEKVYGAGSSKHPKHLPL